MWLNGALSALIYAPLVALSGAALIAVGVFVIAGGLQQMRESGAKHAVAYGLLTGSFIAAYTIWDKHAVSALLIPPLLLDWSANLGRTALLAPLALRSLNKVRAVWSDYRFEVIGVALLTPVSYILVLTALVFTPVIPNPAEEYLDIMPTGATSGSW